jgi:hypothetical protein
MDNEQRHGSGVFHPKHMGDGPVFFVNLPEAVEALRRHGNGELSRAPVLDVLCQNRTPYKESASCRLVMVSASFFYLVLGNHISLDSRQYEMFDIDTFVISSVSRDLSITACDENETKLNMPLYRLSIVMTFVQGDPFQRFNPMKENRR